MSLIDFLPPIGTGGGGGGGGDVYQAGNNAFTAINTFAGDTELNGPLQLGTQTFNLNGGAQTILGTGAGRLIRITGSTASSTINLPASPASGDLYLLDNLATVAWTIAGNGANIDGASTKTVAAGSWMVVYGAAGWESVTISQYFGDARWAQLSGANAFSGANTHAGSEAFSAQFVLAKQSFSATATISDGGGSVVVFTGSTASQTLSLPAAPTTNRIFLIRNQATVSLTLSGNGINLDAAATVTVPVNGCGFLWYDGAAWWSLGPTPWLANNWSNTTTFGGGVTSSNSLSTTGKLNISAFLTISSQTASTSSYTVLNGGSNPPIVASTYSATGAQTISLPTTPVTNEVHVIIDKGGSAATNNITISGNGNTVHGSSVIGANYGVLRFWWDGSAWYNW